MQQLESAHPCNSATQHLLQHCRLRRESMSRVTHRPLAIANSGADSTHAQLASLQALNATQLVTYSASTKQSLQVLQTLRKHANRHSKYS